MEGDERREKLPQKGESWERRRQHRCKEPGTALLCALTVWKSTGSHTWESWEQQGGSKRASKWELKGTVSGARRHLGKVPAAPIALPLCNWMELAALDLGSTQAKHGSPPIQGPICAPGRLANESERRLLTPTATCTPCTGERCRNKRHH